MSLERVSEAIPEEVPVPNKDQSLTGLQGFAASIEKRLQKSKKYGPFATQRLICRLMTSKNEKVAAYMAVKWVEWRFGKGLEAPLINNQIIVNQAIEQAKNEER